MALFIDLVNDDDVVAIQLLGDNAAAGAATAALDALHQNGQGVQEDHVNALTGAVAGLVIANIPVMYHLEWAGALSALAVSMPPAAGSRNWRVRVLIAQAELIVVLTRRGAAGATARWLSEKVLGIQDVGDVHLQPHVAKRDVVALLLKLRDVGLVHSQPVPLQTRKTGLTWVADARFL